MNTEFVIWGIPAGECDEQLLYTKATTRQQAEQVKRILETKKGCTEVRIQSVDLDIAPDFGSRNLLLT